MINACKNIETDNLLLLDEFKKETLLENIYNRYYISKKIYSFIGYSILMAVNPYQNLDYYSEEKKKEYKNFFDEVKINPSIIPKPHLYYLVEESYRNMVENQKDQNFIISGESGSGKTQTTKYIIEYLVNKTNENISEKLMAANPLLEAFGNAKTIKNNNSSRFGKFIKIFFTEQGKLLKANILSYLLEKSRVINIQKGERNYHIFYQFILGSNEEEKLKYEIRNIEYYDYLNNKENNNVVDLNKNMNDVEDFKMTKENLKKFNFSEEDIDNIFKIISGILYLGNIRFKSLNINHIDISDETIEDFKKAAKFLGLEEEILKKILKSYKVYFGGEEIIKNFTKDECYINKDGMAQQIYSQLFDYIITKINQEMDINDENNKIYDTLQISILDIFGFENFKNNSFEQLCINYCNERLQQYFSNHVFKLEQEEYQKEGIKWKSIEYKDNSKIIQLIDGNNLKKGKNDSIFEGLKIQGSFKGNNNKDIDFRNLLYKAFKSNKEYKTILIEDKLEKDSIKINHYAGIIKYNVNGMVKKNLNQTSNDIKIALSDSTNSLISNMFTDPVIRLSKYEKRLKTTLSEQFKKQLDQLFIEFDESNNKYIKCIKPNDKKEPNNFEKNYVLEQLNYGGILETIKIKNQGYPIHQSKEDFYNKYKWLIPEVNNKQLNEEIIQKMVRYLKNNNNDSNPCKKSNINLIEIGKNIIFIKNEFKLFLDFLLNKEKEKRTIKIQAWLRGVTYKNKFKKIRKIQSHYKIYKIYKIKKMVFSKLKSAKELIKIFSNIRIRIIKSNYKKIKILLESIIKIQRNIRGMISRNNYKKNIKKKKELIILSVEEPNDLQLERNNSSGSEDENLNRNSLYNALYNSNENFLDNEINSENKTDANTKNNTDKKVENKENKENKDKIENKIENKTKIENKIENKTENIIENNNNDNNNINNNDNNNHNEINNNNYNHYIYDNINDVSNYYDNDNDNDNYENNTNYLNERESMQPNNIVNEYENSKTKPIKQKVKNETLKEQIGMFYELFDEFNFWVENVRNKMPNNNRAEINKLKKELKTEKEKNKNLYNQIEFLIKKLEQLENENRGLRASIACDDLIQ